jgi:hypothetical protein
MAAQVVLTSRIGNGHAPAWWSRKAFNRSLPWRIGALEDQVDAQEQRLGDLDRTIEAQSTVTTSDPALWHGLTISSRSSLG